MRLMRIAHTVEFYRPRLGGAERVVERLSSHLGARGHSVTVLTSAISGVPLEEELNGVRVRCFDVRGNAATGIRGEVERFTQELTEGLYDVVLNYACQSWPTDLTFRSLDEVSGVKILAPCGYSGLKQSGLKRTLYRSYFRQLPSLLKRYDAVVYHSRDYIDYLQGQAWGLTNGVVIPNGVDLGEFEQLEIRETRDDALWPEVVSIGNHYRVKNHRDFFRLAEAFKRQPIRFSLVATPEKTRRGCFGSCVREAKRTGVRLVDGRDRGQVLSALVRSRALVITSHLECAPLTALETMAAGVPFVSYDVGCVRDFPGGIIVDTLDEMARALRELITDERLWRRLSRAGRYFTAKHDWAALADNYESLYVHLVTRAPSSVAV